MVVYWVELVVVRGSFRLHRAEKGVKNLVEFSRELKRWEKCVEANVKSVGVVVREITARSSTLIYVHG